MDEHIRYLMETMRQQWDSIMVMPYSYFNSTIKWKVDLEEEKAKRYEEEREKQML